MVLAVEVMVEAVTGEASAGHDLVAFRLDRIVHVEPGPASFERPAGFDALAHLRASVATIPRAHRVEGLLRTDLKTAASHFFDAIGTFEQEGDAVLLRSQTDHIAWFASQLARVPFEFEVRAPAALRAAVVGVAQCLRRRGTAAVKKVCEKLRATEIG